MPPATDLLVPILRAPTPALLIFFLLHRLTGRVALLEVVDRVAAPPVARIVSAIHLPPFGKLKCYG
ncbi:MAG: hypothetical protein R6U92_00650 [Bacillota bacterium]